MTNPLLRAAIGRRDLFTLGTTLGLGLTMTGLPIRPGYAAGGPADAVTIDRNALDALFEGRLLPDAQVDVMASTYRLVPSSVIRRGSRIAPLPRAKSMLANVAITSNGTEYDLYDFLALNRVAGMLVLKDGAIAAEHYQLGITPNTLWLSASMAKCVTSTLAGIAIKDGAIRSLDDRLDQYLPELRGSAYGAVTVEQLLRMRTGVAWSEDYADPQSDRRRVLDIHYSQEAGAFLRYMATLPQKAEPGTEWNYNTGEMYLMGCLIGVATGKSPGEYLSARLWQPLGMEQDARWWLLSASGPETGGGGMSACLRDYARFGQFALNRGVINGEKIVPDDWFDRATKSVGDDINFGYQWWTYDRAPFAGGVHEGAFAARGVYGQVIYINPRHNLVITVLSAQPKPVNRAPISDNDFFAGVIEALG